MRCFLAFLFVLLLASSAVSGFRQDVRARSRFGLQLAAKKVTPNDGESMDAYRKAVLGVLMVLSLSLTW